MADLKLSLIITADGKAAVTGIQQVRSAAEGVGSSAHAGATQAGAAFDGLGSKVGALGRNLSALLGISFGAAMVKEAVMVGDAYNTLQSRIQDATRATGNYAQTSQAVFEISQRTGAQLSTSVSLYQSLARSAGELGAKQADVLKLQETVQRLGVIGGASTANLNAGLLQFGQMLAGDVAHAEEMNSLLENIPAVAEAIAKGMGMTTGQLKAAVLEGKVLSQDVMRALLSQSGDVEARFKSMPASIERSTTELNNSWSLFMGNLIKSTGIAEGLASTLKTTADTLTEWGKALDPAKQALAEAESQIIRISERLRESEGQGLLYKWLHGSNDDMRAELNASINNLVALQDQASAFGSKGAAAFNTVSNAAQGTKAAVSDVMRSVVDLNAELRIQLAMGDQSRAHMQAYRNEAKLQTEIDKAMAEGKADVAFALEEERAGVMAVNAENIRLQGTLDASKEAHKAATHHVKAHAAAKRELAKETRDYAREAERAVDFVERENAAIMETSERLLKLAAEYGNSDAKAILYQRQVEEVTRALEAMGATSEEIRAAQNRLWEDMTSEGQAAVKIREANEKAAKEAKEAWQKSADEIERSLTDALLRGFESGKGFAENFRDTLKNMFNTLVLRPIIQAVMAPVAGAVAGMMPGVSSAAGGGGYGDLLSTASNLYSAGSSLWTGIGNAATSIMTGAVVSGFTTGMDIAIANIGAAGYFGAFTTTMSTAISSAASGAVGTAVGAAIPYIGWIIAAVALIAKFMGSNKDTSPDLTLIQGAHRMDPTQGTQFQDTGSDKNNLAGFISDAFGGFFIGTQHADLTAEAKQQLKAMFTAYGQAFDTIAGLISDEMVDAATQALEKLKKQNPERPSAWDDGMAKFFHDRFDILFSTIGGDLEALYNQLLGDVDFGNAADVVQLSNSIAAISTATGDFKTVLDSLLDPTLTNAQAINDLSAKNEIWAATLVRLGAEVVGVNGIFDALGVTLLPLDIVGAQAADALIQLAGGMENLTNASTYFFEHFYTEAEQQQQIVQTTGQVIAAFNEQFRDTITATGAVTDGVIDTKEELRAFVESLDMTTEAGQQAFLAAMALAPTLVANADALAALGQAAGDAIDQIVDAVGNINERLKGNGDNRFNDPNRFGGHNTAPAPGQTGGEAQSGQGVPDIGGWQPWHDTGSAAAGTGGGTVADLSAQLADFMAGIRDGLDRLQLSDFDYSLRALGLEFDALRAKAEALGASAEDMALIDELEGLRESELRAAEAARLAADAARAAAGDLERVGALGSAMNDVQDQLAKLQLSDTDYALRELSINMAALRAQIIALGGSAEDLALVDQLEALRLAQIEAAAAAEAARQAEEAQAEAERQAREQAEAAYEALATAEKQAQQELDALADAMEEFNRAVQSVRDDIAGSVLSILRDQPGWSEADYQRQRITQLRQRIDQASGLEQIALIGELQEAILARYQAERAELEATATQQTDLYSAMEQAHQAELQHYQDVTVALRDLAKYVDSLKLDDRLSTLTPFQKLEEAQRQFYATLGLAQGGDAQAIRDLSGAASAYLQDARAYFASGEQYTAIFDAVTQALEALTGQNVAAPMGEDEWRDFMASLQSTQTDAVVDLSGIQDQALAELQALDELLTILTGEQALAAQEQQAAILETLQEARDTFASFAGEMPEDLARAADDIGATTDAAADRITTAITGAIQSMDQHLADTNAQVSANTQAIAGLQAQLAALAAQNAALSAQNAALQAQLDSNTANLA